MSRPKEWAYAAVLGLLGVLFGFGLLEVGVRLARLEPDRFWEADPVLGARLVPGKKGWWTQEEREFLVWVEINDLGLRDVPRKLEKADGVFRILALGDSFLEALQVPLERAFTQVLERELSSRLGRPVEVINAGHSAYGTAGELLFFRERGVRFDPDLVLLAFYPGNDVLNNSPELEDVLVPVYDERGRPVRIHPRARERREASSGGWLAWSKAYRYLRRMTLWARPELVEWLAGIGVVGERTAERVRKKALPVAYEVYGPPDARWERAWQRTEQLVRELQSEVRRAGSELVAVIVPSREEVCDSCWEELLDAYPSLRARGSERDAPRERAEAMFRRLGVPVFVLASAMKNERAKEFYYRYDGHWNAAGHEFAAGAVADFLLRGGWLREKPAR